MEEIVRKSSNPALEVVPVWNYFWFRKNYPNHHQKGHLQK